MYYGASDHRSFSNSAPKHITVDLTLPGGPLFVQGDGAIPNGSRVAKIHSHPEDRHQDGARGIVLASFGPVRCLITDRDILIYWVAWDDNPEQPVAIVGDRIQDVTPKL